MTNPPLVPKRPLELTRLRVRNFRRIEQLDVEFPEQTRVICFVGPNGSGKSSLLSILANSLCGLTKESAPDLRKASGDTVDRDEWVRYPVSDEIRLGSAASLIRADWQSKERAASFYHVLKKTTDLTEPDQLFPQDISSGHFQFPRDSWFATTWGGARNWSDDPVAEGVLLIRPPDRWEQPNYEEPFNLTVAPFLNDNWDKCRVFPIRIRSWGLRLEQFLLQMFVASHTHPDDFICSVGQALWSSIFQKLLGEEFRFNIGRWPFTRVGYGRHPQMSSLSSGELDVLVTAAVIIAQTMQIAFVHDETKLEPRGFVFIDEVDAHLHPQWQQKVMPLLTEIFPQITFVITTHSPFVLRSLKKETSRVIRLPDGEVFDTEFAAWQIDDILEAVFEVPAQWAPGISVQLAQLKKLVPDSERILEATTLYKQLLTHDSAALQAECRRIAGLFGSCGFMDAVAKRELPDHQPAGTVANGDSHP